MNIITENPYRIIGVLSNSSEREIHKQKAKLNAYLSAGKDLKLDYDYEVFGNVKRDLEIVQNALNSIDQPKYKLRFALFWFIKNNAVDEAALEHLNDNNVAKAKSIWEMTLKSGNITSQNFSSAINLATLNLGIITRNGSFDKNIFIKSIKMHTDILMSGYFADFVKVIAGDKFVVEKSALYKGFLDETLALINPYLNKQNGISVSDFIESFECMPSEYRQYLTGKFVDAPINSIESQINIAKNIRVESPEDAFKTGEKLYTGTKNDVNKIREVLNFGDVNLDMIINKLANEVLQCAIDYFVVFRDSEYDPGNESFQLINYASTLNPSGQVKNRIAENIKNIKDWIDDSDERNEYKKIKTDSEFIYKELNKLISEYPIDQ